MHKPSERLIFCRYQSSEIESGICSDYASLPGRISYPTRLLGAQSDRAKSVTWRPIDAIIAKVMSKCQGRGSSSFRQWQEGELDRPDDRSCREI